CHSLASGIGVVQQQQQPASFMLTATQQSNAASSHGSTTAQQQQAADGHPRCRTVSSSSGGICSDRATGKHYERLLLRRLQGFFPPELHGLTGTSGTSARYCRLDKCFRAGMRKEAVQNRTRQDQLTVRRPHYDEQSPEAREAARAASRQRGSFLGRSAESRGRRSRSPFPAASAPLAPSADSFAQQQAADFSLSRPSCPPRSAAAQQRQLGQTPAVVRGSFKSVAQSRSGAKAVVCNHMADSIAAPGCCCWEQPPDLSMAAVLPAGSSTELWSGNSGAGDSTSPEYACLKLVASLTP
uniref:Nuclear receptor domain-containing protein n=1 Tax=Macrostomum lignano TaxID=282301 RepID=A0A1I8F938_9PLAT